LEPEDECGLEDKVEGEVVKDHPQGNALDEVEETKDAPVGKPLDVILVLRGLDSLEGEEGREAPANEVGDGEGEGVEEEEEGEEGNGADGGICLGDLRPGLELVGSGVLAELLVNLADVVGSLLLDVDDGGVLRHV